MNRNTAVDATNERKKKEREDRKSYVEREEQESERAVCVLRRVEQVFWRRVLLLRDLLSDIRCEREGRIKPVESNKRRVLKLRREKTRYFCTKRY